ncbi:hypothetical protein GCM10010976_14350 [Bizionia arctica]|uniref:PAS domain S-box protein n=1 Tax=Bizionia arctica TaxID=1495645 RepID=A0A917GG42_9FLAO|nr:hypothetical protein GCM10010976_14350 [Bizionia arctica]
MFKLRTKLGLAPLYIFLGAIQYLQALTGSLVSFQILGDFTASLGTVIVFSAVLFAVLLIYIKEGVSSARALILGIVISNLLITVLFKITYIQDLATRNLNRIEPFSLFTIDYKYFIIGTIILLLDFILLAVVYQFLISKIRKQYFFLILFISLFTVLLFDSFTFNISLNYFSEHFVTFLLGDIIGKTILALVFSFILYTYLKYLDTEKYNASFIANQHRDVFSILRYRKKYLDLKVEKQEVELKLVSQSETALNNISDGFVSLDTNWRYVFVNKRAGEILGRSPESLIGKHIWTEFPQAVDTIFYKAYLKAVESQETQHIEEYHEALDRWIDGRAYPSANGLTIYLADVTEEKKVDIENKMLLSLIETSDDFIGLASLEGKPIYLNVNGRKLVGLGSDEKLSASMTDFFPEHFTDKILNDHLPNIYKNNKWRGEVQLKNFKTGSLTPIEMSGFLIKDSTTSKPMALGIVATDISKGNEAKEKLIKSEQLFRRLSSSAPVAIFQTDKDGGCNYVNEQWIKYSGLSFEEAMGLSWTNALHPEDKDRMMHEWQETVSKETDLLTDFRFLNKNGMITWLSAKTTGLYDSNNNLYGHIGTLVDVTDRKKAEDQRIKSEKYLDSIINNIGDPVFVKDEQSRMLLVNDALCSIFNLNRADIIGKTLAEHVPLKERENFLKNDKQVILDGIENVKEETLSFDKMEMRTISTKKTRFIDSTGNKFLIGVIRDITEQKKAEVALKESEEKFSKAFESNVIGTAILNKEKKIIEINEVLTNIVGFKRENMLGKTAEEIGLFKFDSQKNLENENKLWSQFSKNGYVSNIELEYLMQTGRELFILISLRALRLNNEDHILITVLDITEKKNVEKELEKHRNNLEELVKIRTEEVNSKNNELQRMNKLFVGRELKMKELKNIIKELQSKNDN